jgi:tagatose-1,6-bisphosphate aldolase
VGAPAYGQPVLLFLAQVCCKHRRCGPSGVLCGRSVLYWASMLR